MLQYSHLMTYAWTYTKINSFVINLSCYGAAIIIIKRLVWQPVFNCQTLAYNYFRAQKYHTILMSRKKAGPASSDAGNRIDFLAKLTAFPPEQEDRLSMEKVHTHL